jgi:hypothetical protein
MLIGAAMGQLTELIVTAEIRDRPSRSSKSAGRQGCSGWRPGVLGNMTGAAWV